MQTMAKLKYHANFRTGNRVEPVEIERKHKVRISGRWYYRKELRRLDVTLGAFVNY